MKKKLLSLLLAISLIAGLFPAVTAGAETTATTAPTTEATTASTTAPTTVATTAPTTAPTTVATTAPTTAATTAPTTAPTTAATTAPTTAPTTLATTAPTNASAFSVSVKLCETGASNSHLAVLTASKGGKPVYATTNGSGSPTLITGDTVPTDNYVKFEYPENDLPTITLMNAKLRASGNVLDLSSFDISVKIVIAGSSSIESTTKCGIFRESYGDIIILGPKKLTINCYSSAIAFEGYDYGNSLALKNVTLKATTMANTAGRAIQIPSGNLTVDESTVDIVNHAGIAVYLSRGSAADSAGRGNAAISNSVFSATSQNTALQLDGDLTITSSNAQFSSEARAVYCNGNLTASSSTLVITGSSNAFETVDVGGEFTLRTTNAEIISTSYAIFSGTTVPRLIGEYSAVAGLNRDSVAPYDEVLASAYQYFYAESLEQPDDPTLSTEAETEPTEEFADPSLSSPTEPTDEPVEMPVITVATVPTPTIPTDSSDGNNSTLFWILAILMVLGAGGAATMAILMFRRNAEEAFEEDFEESEEITEEDIEDIEETPKKFSLKNFKKLFTKTVDEDTDA